MSERRAQLEELARRAFASKLQGAAEAKRQERPEGDVEWAYSYGGNPRGFFRELIGSQWDGPDWLAWRSFISAVFVQPFQSDEEQQIFEQCTSLTSPPIRRPPSVWMPVGRRGGKSRTLAAIAVFLACCHDWSPYLDPGELGVIPVLAADRRQARTIMGYVKAFLEHQRLRNRVMHASAESIQLQGNILIEVVTASYRAVRSRTVLAALCDEIAFWHSEEESANPDHEIIAALEPAMATIPNALLLGASSPYSRRGVLWDMYDRYYGKPGGPFIWRASTMTMNPTVPKAFLDEKYEQDPQAAAAEYGAEFRSDVDAFVTREALEAVMMRGIFEIPYVMGVRYMGFVDPSGGSSDSMTLAIGHIDRTSGRAVLDVLRERRPPFSPEAVAHDFAATLAMYKISKISGDHYAGEWPKEQFRHRGIAYEISERRKSEIYLEFLPFLNAGRVELLDDKRLYNQFLALERRTSRSGFESIDHAPGAHDDLANVCAGVVVELMGKGRPLAINQDIVRKSATLIRPQYARLDDLMNRAHNPRWNAW